MSNLQNWGRYEIRNRPMHLIILALMHTLYIPLPLEIKVDWFDFFDEVLEQVRAGDWQALTEALAEPASPMKWFFWITFIYYLIICFTFRKTITMFGLDGQAWMNCGPPGTRSTSVQWSFVIYVCREMYLKRTLKNYDLTTWCSRLTNLNSWQIE